MNKSVTRNLYSYKKFTKINKINFNENKFVIN